MVIQKNGVKMIDKKGLMKTVEVFIAALITLTFVIIILPPKYSYNQDISNNVFNALEKDPVFRRCVILEDDACIDEKIENSLFGYYNFTYDMYNLPSEETPRTFSAENVNTYTVVISGNRTSYNPKIFKLYYWVNNDNQE